jgi:hypothetical protein
MSVTQVQLKRMSVTHVPSGIDDSCGNRLPPVARGRSHGTGGDLVSSPQRQPHAGAHGVLGSVVLPAQQLASITYHD